MTTHSAPPVAYPLGRCVIQACLLAGVWCAGLLLALLWIDSSHPPGWAMALLACSLVVAGLAAWVAIRKPALGQLSWDGHLWRWESASYRSGLAEQQLVVIADFQHLLLLRIENPARAALWLWAERKAFPSRWMDFRRAVYSPQRLSTDARWQPFIPAEPAPPVTPSGPAQNTGVGVTKP